jgi:hypothetical protein
LRFPLSLCSSAALLALIGCTAIERPQLTAISVSPRDAIVRVGSDAFLRVVGTFDNGWTSNLTGVEWRSGNPAVARVNPYGTVVGVREGTAVIRAQLAGKRDSILVRVSNEAPAHRMGPLRVSSANPRYFADPAGNVVYLTGSHYWKNVQDDDIRNPPEPFDNTRYLDFLERYNHNFTRLWVWEQARWSDEVAYSHWFSPTIYRRTGPGIAADGGAKFDLNKLNPAFFSRLRQRVIDARARGIYVSVMLFDGWSLETKPGNAKANPWRAHPFNADNNINGVNGDPNHDASGREIQTLSNPAITALQEAYVKAVIDAVNDQDNVLYEISNESDSSGNAWQYHMIEFVRAYEASKPEQHPIGMTVPWPGSNADVLNSPADWVSMNGSISEPAPATGRKVSLSDTDHLCGICGDAVWVWKSLLRGHNPLLMDGYNNSPGVSDPAYHPADPKWDAIRLNLGYARSFAQRMDLARAEPDDKLASRHYCLTRRGKEYLVLLPTGGDVEVDLEAAQGYLNVEWFDPSTGETLPGGQVKGGGTIHLTAPFSGPAVLYVRV